MSLGGRHGLADAAALVMAGLTLGPVAALPGDTAFVAWSAAAWSSAAGDGHGPLEANHAAEGETRSGNGADRVESGTGGQPTVAAQKVIHPMLR